MQVSLAEYSLFHRALLQKRPIISSILLTEATPYRSYRKFYVMKIELEDTATHGNTRQHTATHGNTRQHTATHTHIHAHIGCIRLVHLMVKYRMEKTEKIEQGRKNEGKKKEKKPNRRRPELAASD